VPVSLDFFHKGTPGDPHEKNKPSQAIKR